MQAHNKPTYEQKRQLGFVIYLYRSQMGMSQEQLAEALGHSTRWIQKIESGQANPSWTTLLTIISLLGIPVNELCEEVGIRVPVPSL